MWNYSRSLTPLKRFKLPTVHKIDTHSHNESQCLFCYIRRESGKYRTKQDNVKRSTGFEPWRLSSNIIRDTWVFPKCFHWIQWQKILYFKKTILTCYLLCKRPRCYLSTSKTQVAEIIFKLSPIHASVIYQIPWIRAEFTEFLIHYEKGQLTRPSHFH